jgi:hypothetical protein
MAFAAGLCPSAAWGNRQYRMQLLLAPSVALQRCWEDSNSMFGCIKDWQAQVWRAGGVIEARACTLCMAGWCTQPCK